VSLGPAPQWVCSLGRAGEGTPGTLKCVLESLTFFLVFVVAVSFFFFGLCWFGCCLSCGDGSRRGEVLSSIELLDGLDAVTGNLLLGFLYAGCSPEYGEV